MANTEIRVATQLYIIKQMPEVKKISMKELNQEGADLAFNGVISLNKDIGK